MRFSFKYIHLFFYLIFYSFTMAQSNIISINTEGGFADITFPVLSVETFQNDRIKINISGEYNEEKIEFSFISKEMFKAGIGENGLINDAVEFQGIRVLIDDKNGRSLVNLFSTVYGIKPDHSSFRTEIVFTAIPMSKAPANIKSELIRLKVFYDDQFERDEYFEMFIIIDLKSKTVEFSEKDIEYRKTIIKVLSTSL